MKTLSELERAIITARLTCNNLFLISALEAILDSIKELNQIKKGKYESR